jgi:hypothetical protein
MVKLNSQKTIQNVENDFLKENLPILKIGDNVKIGVKLSKVVVKGYNFTKERLLQKRIV